MVAITGDPNSRLAEHSDIVLSMGKLSEACPLGIAPSVSTTCMLAVGDALSFTVMKARNFSPEDYARFHPGGALGAKLLTVGQTAMFTKDQKLPVCRKKDTIADMLKRTSEIERRGAVMVVDSEGKLSGIITDADLRRAMTTFSDEVLEKEAQAIMTAAPKRVREDTLAAEAMAVFHKHRIDELPVVNEYDEPVGLIDVQDIVAIKIVG
jgi:arabinose-5-phosphate isomerase